MLHNSLGQLIFFASIPSKPCVPTSQRLFETPMVVNPEFSFAVCFSELAVRDQKVISYKNINYLYYSVLAERIQTVAEHAQTLNVQWSNKCAKHVKYLIIQGKK